MVKRITLAAPASCCPVGSVPPPKAPSTSPEGFIVPGPKGRLIQAHGLEIYVHGKPSQHAVIVLPEVWGITSGRLRYIADMLGDAGYYALLPKIQPNSPFGGWEGDGYGSTSTDENLFIWIDKEMNWDKTKVRLQKVIQHAKDQGAKKIGMMGFCWSTWAIFKASAEFQRDVTCGVNCHPSVRLEEWLYKRSQHDLANRVTCPMALFAAGNDPDDVKPGGSFEKILRAKEFGNRCVFVEFPDMQHGWVSRGDDRDPKVKRDIERALNLTLEFFNKNLRGDSSKL